MTEAPPPSQNSTPNSEPAPETQPTLDRENSGSGLAKEPPAPGPYVAKAGSYYRNVRYVIAAITFAMGLYFLYDGFVGYPTERDRFRELTAQATTAQEAGDTAEAARLNQLLRDEGVEDHSDADILLQKILGFTLPPLAVLLLVRWLYISRGEVRLDETDTLHAPGHPAIPLTAVREVDDTLWDRKGIAYVAYDLGDNQSGRVKLDDFVYDRKPIDQIHDRLVYLRAQ